MNFWRKEKKNKTTNLNEYMKNYREENSEKIKAIERSNYYKKKYADWFTPEELVIYAPILDDIYKIKKIVKKNKDLFPNLLSDMIHLEKSGEDPILEIIDEKKIEHLEEQNLDSIFKRLEDTDENAIQ